jgi:putative transposase
MSTKIHRQYQQSFHVIQDARSQIREMVRNHMRDSTLLFIHDLFREEIEGLCGPAYSRKGEDGYHRGGSDPGSVIFENQRVAVKKPRAHKGNTEVELQSYAALQGFDLLQEKILKVMMSGVSTRNYETVIDEVSGGLGLKKSSVSKAFKMGSLAAFDMLNGRDLSPYTWAAIMVDGIEFGGSCVIVALGITTEGKKLILGLKKGDSEDSEVCKDLFQNLIERKLNTDNPFLFVLDGSKALKKAVRKVFGERFPIQRCVRHKERNILKYLQKQYHAEFRRRWKMLHGITRYDDAKLEHDRLAHWLGERNQEALASLQEADLETLTVIRLRAGALLRKTLLSTNPIESAFDKVRSRTGRVKRWRLNGNQIQRWCGTALLTGEKGFKTIKGHKEIAAFMEEIKIFNLPTQQEAA